MQLDFNHTKRLSLHRHRPVHRFNQFWWMCVVLIFFTLNSPVHGQAQRHNRFQYQNQNRQSFPQQPRNFGDTPSPTEMMARLKFHKHQETPLFDLLREAGDDIFSKLSDDEKKLAARFVEDMILKEGMDSDKVSTLMEHMNINDAAKQALQDGIERAGGKSAISPEDRKKLANQIRKQFLQQSGNQENLQSPTNRNWRQSPDSSSGSPQIANQGPPHLGTTGQVAGDLDKPLDEKIKSLKRLVNKIREQHPTAPGRQEASEDYNRDQATQPFRRDNELVRDTNRSTVKPDQITGEQNINSPQASVAASSQSPAPRDATSPSQPATASGEQPLNKSLAQEAFRQLEEQLSDSEKKVVSELKDNIQAGKVTKQEIEALFSELQSTQSPKQLAKQLDEVGKSIGLPPDSRKEVQEAFNQLSGDQRHSLQQALNGVNKQALSDLIDRTNEEQSATESFGASSQQTASSPNANTGQTNNLQLEDLGREFLQDALKTYNDPDSGYKLSKAFQQLKDQAEGVRSDRQLANLGNISQKLLEDSSKLFEPIATSDTGKKSGVKPGQRFDQLLTSAASKALVDSAKGNPQEDDSVLSNMLNQALGVAIDQAVTAAADKDLSVRTHDATTDWNEPSDLSYLDNSNWPDQLNTPGNNDSNFQPYDTTGSPTASNSTNSPNSPANNSVQDSATHLSDAFSELEFNWRTIFYAIGTIILLAGCIYLLNLLMQPVSEAELKQRELQRKLKTSSSSPKDLVEAVDLFLLSRFGAASSWWNAQHAAKQISEIQPDWRDKVASLFQVYRWSRYQAGGQASVSPEQNDLVKSTLRELSQVPIESFDKTNASQNGPEIAAVDAEGKA